MLASKKRFLASAFVDADSIHPTSQDISELLKLLKDDQLLPIQANEQSISGNIPRIGFQSPDGKRRFLLLGKRFDFSYHSNKEEGKDIGSFVEFCQEAFLKLKIAMEYFNRNSHRLAAIQEGYITELTKEKLDIIAKTLVNKPPVFSDDILFEWDWRCASLIERFFSGIKELTNTIITIRKRPTSGLIEQSQLGSIRIDIDINTTHYNTKSRFGVNEVQGFLELAPSWLQKLDEDINSFMGLEV